MSFTTEVKSEIAQNELKPCCQKAELSALVQLCSSLTINAQGMSLMIKTENAATAKRILKLLKENYAVETDLSVIKKMNLKKNKKVPISILIFQICIPVKYHQTTFPFQIPHGL